MSSNMSPPEKPDSQSSPKLTSSLPVSADPADPTASNSGSNELDKPVVPPPSSSSAQNPPSHAQVDSDDEKDDDNEGASGHNDDPPSDSEPADRLEPVRRGVPPHRPMEIVEGETIDADENVLDGYDEDATDLDLVHLRISSIPKLRLERFRKLNRLCLRQNLIRSIKLPESLGETLEELDLYDNSISKIKGLDAFSKLTSLDLSFNHIEHIKHLEHMTELEDLFLVQNSIKKIRGLETLAKLKNLELGANQIRVIENLESLQALEKLWLGKNKITNMTGLDTLSNLRLLSIQANRLVDLSGLSNLKNLTELYISHNAITSLEPLRELPQLEIVDVSNNPITSLAGVSALTALEDLWASNCKIAEYEDVQRECRNLKSLETIYLEGNPLHVKFRNQYRQRIIHMLPQIKQLDANIVRS